MILHLLLVGLEKLCTSGRASTDLLHNICTEHHRQILHALHDTQQSKLLQVVIIITQLMLLLKLTTRAANIQSVFAMALMPI